MSNFIPNDFIKIQPKDLPWITTEIKRLIKQQNRFYKNFKRKGCKPEEKEVVGNIRNECSNAINHGYLETVDMNEDFRCIRYG